MSRRLTAKTAYTITLIVILLLAALYFFDRYQDKKHDVSKKVKAVTTVTLAPIKRYIVPQTVTSYGTLVSPQSALLTAQVPGIVSSIDFTAGKRVKAGQVLFTMRVTDMSNQPDKLKAIMESSKDKYDRYQHENIRVQGSVATIDLTQYKLKYLQDLADYKQAIALSTIKSPISGIISDTDLTVGSSVKSGDALASVIDPKSLQVKYQVPNQYAKQVRLGQKVQFYPNNMPHGYSGEVAYIAPQLNTTDYSLTLRANFDKPQLLRPNLFGKVVQVLNANYTTWAIPQTLVQTDAQGFYVYTVDQHKVTKHYFVPGQVTKTGLIAVKSGLAAHTLIITSNVSNLSPGQTVKVKSP